MEPWTGFYFWQPGYLPYAGVMAGTAYALWRIGRGLPSKRWVHLRTLCSGYAGGVVALGAMIVALYAFTPPTLLGRGDRVPDFALVDLDGNPARLSDLAGHGLILDFWATWCPPCRREMPLLDEIHAKYGQQQLSVIGIDLGEAPDVVHQGSGALAIPVRGAVRAPDLPSVSIHQDCRGEAGDSQPASDYAGRVHVDGERPDSEPFVERAY